MMRNGSRRRSRRKAMRQIEADADDRPAEQRRGRWDGDRAAAIAQRGSAGRPMSPVRKPRLEDGHAEEHQRQSFGAEDEACWQRARPFARPDVLRDRRIIAVVQLRSSAIFGLVAPTAPGDGAFHRSIAVRLSTARWAGRHRRTSEIRPKKRIEISHEADAQRTSDWAPSCGRNRAIIRHGVEHQDVAEPDEVEVEAGRTAAARSSGA